MKTRKLTAMALMTGAALMIHYVESLLPALVPVPGVKPGLANIVTLLALYMFAPRDALLIVAARLILGAFVGGSFSALLYAAAGSAVSLAVMLPLARVLPPRYMYLASILGAAGHNLGQIAVAVAVTRTPSLVVYLPVLTLSGCIAGAFTGFCASFTYLRLIKK